MVLGVIVMACMNAMIVPLALEKQILVHPRSQPIFAAARQCGQAEGCWSFYDGLEKFVSLSKSPHLAKCGGNVSHVQR